MLGYMGSGKSTIGRKLAAQLDYDFIDLDHYIESSEQMTVKQLFASKGEIYFRKREHDYLVEIMTQKDDFILATGGGTPCYGDNMEHILNFSQQVIYLKLSVTALAERLSKEKEDRPLIKNILDQDLPEFIGKHLFERNFFYNRAPYTVDCDGETIEGVVTEIKAHLGLN